MSAGSLPSGPLPPSDARLVLLTRRGCHLCELGEREVAAIAESEQVSVRLVDLDACHPDVRAAWTDHVPVAVVDGVVVSIWAVDAEKLRGALSADVTHNRMHNASTSDASSIGGDVQRGAEGSGR